MRTLIGLLYIGIAFATIIFMWRKIRPRVRQFHEQEVRKREQKQLEHVIELDKKLSKIYHPYFYALFCAALGIYCFTIGPTWQRWIWSDDPSNVSFFVRLGYVIGGISFFLAAYGFWLGIEITTHPDIGNRAVAARRRLKRIQHQESKSRNRDSGRGSER